MKSVTWEMGQQGGVSGDCFVKVAYESAWVDPAENHHAGRVRILPLNSAYCFPVEENEILTKRGWLSADELTTEDLALSRDPETDNLVWTKINQVNIFDWDGPIYDWNSKYFSASSTSDHRWLVKDYRGRTKIRPTKELHDLKGGELILSGGNPVDFPESSEYSDEFVELVGWTSTEGNFDHGYDAINIVQSSARNPEFCGRIEKLAVFFENEGHRITRRNRDDGCLSWYFPVSVGRAVRKVLHTNKGINADFISYLTKVQAELLFNTLLDGDGDTRRLNGRERLYQSTWELMDSFQMLAMMLGKRSIAKLSKTGRDSKHGDFDGTVGVHQGETANLKWMERTERHFQGRVWCPTTKTGTWVTRRKEVIGGGDGFKKTVYLTGNCFPT